MKLILSLIACMSLGLFAGCATLTPTRSIQSSYDIYDIKVPTTVSVSKLVAAIKSGLQEQTNEVQFIESIPPSPLPEKPGRFRLTNPFGNQGKQFEVFAQMSGQTMEIPTCDSSIVTAYAKRTGMSEYGEETAFFLCLLPYKGGYHLDIHVRFTMESGGFSVRSLGTAIARSIAGNSSQFTANTIESILNSVRQIGASITLVEAYPPPDTGMVETTATTPLRTASNAQFTPGSNVIGATIGLSSIGSSVALGVDYEHCFAGGGGPGTFGIGAQIQYWGNNDNNILLPVSWAYDNISISGTGGYHFPLDRWDTFILLLFGYHIVSPSLPDFYDLRSIYSYDQSHLFLGGQIGARYFFTPTLAAHARLGFGATLLSVGVDWKF